MSAVRVPSVASSLRVELPEPPAVPEPFLKWPGGKRRLLTRLVPDLMAALRARGEAAVYVEPFLGAGAVFFGLYATGWPGLSVLSDANPRLMATWAAVQNDAMTVARAYLSLMDDFRALPAAGQRAWYEARRSEFNVLPANGSLHAAAMLTLDTLCFNGLWRENRSGEMNAPFGKPSGGRWSDGRDRAGKVLAAGKALQGKTRLVRSSYDALPLLPWRNCVIYCDPPYWGSWSDYSAGGFSADDHAKLAAWCRRAVEAGAHVVASNSDAPEVRSLYPGWQVEETVQNNSINRVGSARAAGRREIILRSPQR